MTILSIPLSKIICFAFRCFLRLANLGKGQTDILKVNLRTILMIASLNDVGHCSYLFGGS